MPCSSRACAAICSRISSSDSPWNMVAQPGTTLAAPELLHVASLLLRAGTPWREATVRREPRRPTIRSRDVPRARVSRRADLAGARALRDRQLAGPPVLQPADDGHVPQPRRLRDGRVGPALGPGRGSVRLPRDDAAGVRPQPAQPGRQARADVPDRARPRRHPQRARDRRRDEPAPVPLPRRGRRAGAQRPPARVRAHALRPAPARPARAGAADRGHDGLRVDLRARALAARRSLRHAGDRASSPTPRRPRCASCARSARGTGSTPRRR